MQVALGLLLISGLGGGFVLRLVRLIMQRNRILPPNSKRTKVPGSFSSLRTPRIHQNDLISLIISFLHQQNQMIKYKSVPFFHWVCRDPSILEGEIHLQLDAEILSTPRCCNRLLRFADAGGGLFLCLPVRTGLDDRGFNGCGW